MPTPSQLAPVAPMTLSRVEHWGNASHAVW
jgi:hypothetical protein